MGKIIISGITDYSDPEDHRFRSTVRFLEKAHAQGLAVYLVDSSSDPLVRNQLETLATKVVWVSRKGNTYRSKKTLALNVSLTAFSEGESGALFLTEMEKDDLVEDIHKLSSPILQGVADLVIPARSLISWSTYPKEMKEIEGFALAQVAHITGYAVDTLFGPFAIHTSQAHRFLSCQAEKWAWLHQPRFEMLKEAPERIVSLPVDFQYPEEQRQAEEGNLEFYLKRLEQLPYTLEPLLQVFAPT